MSSGALGRRGSARWLIGALVLAILSIAVMQQPLDAHGEGPADQVTRLVGEGLIDQAVADRLASEGSVDAILVLRDSAIIASYESLKRAAGANDDSPAILAAKEADYAALKAAVAQSAGSGMTVLQDYNHFATQHVQFTSLAALAAAASDPRTLLVGENQVGSHTGAQTLPLINQPLAALSGRTGSGVSVAVLDTGLDYLRPHFGCTAVATPVSTCRVAAMQEFPVNDGQPDDGSFHGTNVSAIVSAVAPDVKVLGLDVFQFQGSDHVYLNTSVLDALNYVVTNQATYNIRAANMSIGVYGTRSTVACTTPFTSAFANLRAAGVIPVVAAGNHARNPDGGAFADGVSEPGCTAGALSVGAVYDFTGTSLGWTNCGGSEPAAPDKIVCFSQSGPNLGMLAPGPMSTFANLSMGGTSQATPHVAGAVAVLASAVPSQNVDQRQASLTGSGPQITDARNGQTKRRLDVCAALINAGSTCPGGTTNDNRANATQMTSSPALFRESTNGFTVEGADPSPSCAFTSGQQARTAWFKLQTQTAGNLSANTNNSVYPHSGSNNDTVLSVHQDTGGGNLTQVACDEDSGETFLSALTNVALQAGQTYYVLVGTDPAGAATGGYLVLNMSYSGTLAGGIATTDSIAWTGQPADRGVGVALPNLTIEARTGGILNTADSTTQITLSLDDQSSFRGGLEIAGDNQPPTGRSAELQSLAAGRGHVRASFHDDGTLRSLAALDQPFTAASSDSPEQIARSFLANIAGLRGVSTGYDANLRVQKVDDSPSGLVVVGFTQEVGGLPVFDAYAKVGMNAQGQVIAFSSELLGSGDIIAGPPVITAEQSVAAAESLVGPAPSFDGADEFTAQGAALFEPVVSLVAYDTGAGLGIAYMIFVITQDDGFTVLVDATSGVVVYQQSMTAHVGPEGTVFTEHPDAGPRTVESFNSQVAGQPKWTSSVGQNSGWTCPVHVPARPCLIGNNVAAIIARNGQFGGSPTPTPVFLTFSNAADEFNFNFTDGWKLTGDAGIDADMGATLTTLFYFNNMVHDWLHDLGFDAASGNFQDNNFSQGGVAGDAVWAFSQYGAAFCDIPQSTCRNNANFTTFPDGQDGLMRMYLFDDPARRDGSLDGDVIVHEYGHGVSNRLIDPAQANGLVSHQSRAMGEGWSDFFAVAYTNDKVMGEYVTTDAVDGIRHHNYSNHPWTYSHMCQTDYGQGPTCSYHQDGEIWAAALVVMRDNLMAAGYTSDEVVTLVMDGLMNTPEQPDYLDARDALVFAASQTSFTPTEICDDIWSAFAAKGMGFSAQSSNADDTSVQDGFDLPPSCGGGGGGATLTCTGGLTKTVSAGVATWTGCSVDTAGVYKIVADATGTPANQLSVQFVIGGGGGGGPATQLGWATQPGNGVMNLPLTIQPVVQVRDSNGQVVTGSNATVTLELVAPPTVQSPPVAPDAAARKPLVGKDSLLPDLAAQGTPTDDWAVWIVPGTDPVSLAASLGATYVGPGAGIDNVHIFRFDSTSQLRHPVAVSALESSPLVTQYEQQVLLDTDTRVMPSDPGVATQWHLKNTGQGGRTPGVDINVEPAWNLGYTGTGVTVGIVDDSLEYTHPDLAANYDPLRSFDFVSTDLDPAPMSVNDNHGTAVAGLVGAAANNGVCGSGVAHNAALAGIRGGGYALSDATTANMVAYIKETIDIYNNSWGPSDNGTVLGAIGSQTLAAIQGATTLGRGGLGNLFVWAGGNGRQFGDNANFDGYANLRQVIAVAAIEGSGAYSPYSEAGANLLISTPGGTNSGDIYTTDRAGFNGYNGSASPGGDCTGGFNGTSAAAPIASGALAILLQANPNLTWRDVQHILVNTATKVNPGEPDWAVNAAGHDINHNYGFGLLNTSAAVNAALSWTNVGPEISATSNQQTLNAAIPDNNPSGISSQVVMNGNLKIEHVELVFNATHQRRGDIEVTLTSPTGTISKLAVKRPGDASTNGFVNWKFSSTRHWDEMMQGTWTVTVKDSAAGNTGSWTNFTLNFYGTQDTGGGPAVLTCDGGLSKQAVNGVASFTGCKVSGEGAGYQIRATSGGLTQTQSIAFNVTHPDYDATCDGSMDAGDALAVLRSLAGYSTQVVVGPCTGNADGDGSLGLDDALLIRRRVAGFF